MGNFVEVIWVIFQVVIGYNLILPCILLVIWIFARTRKSSADVQLGKESDFAVIVTAYQHTSMLNGVVSSILAMNYRNFHVYVVADNCGDAILDFDDSRVSVLRPPVVLASNTKSHLFAVDNFLRPHNYLTIIDSDNLVHPEYLNYLTLQFSKGYKAVQGLRAPKNLNTTIAQLDAARDIYYHFYDGKVLFEVGSSATLSGSGMAFDATLYAEFLNSVHIEGAGFDKVLQAWLVRKQIRIAFTEHAIVYDEKTSKTEQLVQQRSRWINSWFKYARLGLEIFAKGIGSFSWHQFLFGLVLLRPPLFIFLALSVLLLTVNLIFGMYFSGILWLAALLLFVVTFFISLLLSKADERILSSLKNIPKFMFYQFISLANARRANKISVSTKHEQQDSTSV